MSAPVPHGSDQGLPDDVEDALADALLRSPAERERRLNALIADHRDLAPALCRRIAELQGAGAGPTDFGAVAPRDPDDAPTPGAEDRHAAGARIGRYKLLEQIAEGGMGVVWMAEQREPVRRRVAVKVIKLGMDTRQVMARFAAERQALAMMDHPHIAKVFDAGSTAAGRPYFVMEYIRGIPILEYCDREQLGTRMRLELFVKVCQAIQHAHQKGVIHRDIKPANVLVTLHDGVPVPKVIDFGVAKATGFELTDRTLFTAHRQMVGTPAYMSPEQAEMSGLDVDTRSDVYSLGVLLYELLTGTTPFDNRELLTKGFVEMVRTIREEEPHKPSTRISTLGADAQQVAAQRRVDPRRLDLLLRGELDWIVMKCLEKDRSRRYDSADGLAEDVRRHLDLQPVLAGAPSAGYRLRKFVRRNRGQVLTAGVVAAALVAGVVVSGFGWRRALEEQHRADAARQEEAVARDQAELLAGFMSDTLAAIGPSVARGRDTTMLAEMMDAAAQRLERGELESTPAADVRLRLTIGGIYRELALYDAAETMLAPALRLARERWPDDHPEVARAMSHLATLHYVRGNLADAEQLARDSLAMHERLFAGDDRRLAASQGNLAVVLQARGALAEAERLYRASLAMNRRLFSGDHAKVAWSMQALATLLSVSGDAAAAESLCRESLAMYRRLFSGDDPSVATGMGHLAIMLHDRGDLAAAETSYRDSLAMNRRLFPGDHPNVATGLNALAMLLRDRGELADATPLFVESMEMSRRLFPGDQPNRAVDQGGLAGLYSQQRQFDRSIPLFEEVLAAQDAKLGRGHLDTLTTMAQLGVDYCEVGRHADALPLLEPAARASLTQPTLAIARPALLEAYAMAGGLLGPGDVTQAVGLVEQLCAVEAAAAEASVGADAATDEPGRGTALELLSRRAGALLGLRQWDAAEPLLAECLATRRTHAPDHWQTFRCASRHGAALLGLGRIAAAEPLLLEGYRGIRARAATVPAAAGPSLVHALERLVELYALAGDARQHAAWRLELEAAATPPGPSTTDAGGR